MKSEIIYWIILLGVIVTVREFLIRSATIDRYGVLGIFLLVIGLLIAIIGASRTVWKKK